MAFFLNDLLTAWPVRISHCDMLSPTDSTPPTSCWWNPSRRDHDFCQGPLNESVASALRLQLQCLGLFNDVLMAWLYYLSAAQTTLNTPRLINPASTKKKKKKLHPIRRKVFESRSAWKFWLQYLFKRRWKTCWKEIQLLKHCKQQVCWFDVRPPKDHQTLSKTWWRQHHDVRLLLFRWTNHPKQQKEWLQQKKI